MRGKISAVFGSISFKILGIMSLLAFLAVGATFSGYRMASSFGKSMQEFQTEQIPRLESAAKVLDAASSVSDGLSAVLIAEDSDAMETALSRSHKGLDTLQVLAQDFEGDARTDLENSVSLARQRIDAVAQARVQEVASDTLTLDLSANLGTVIMAAQKQISGLASSTLDRMDKGAGDVPASAMDIKVVRVSGSLEKSLAALETAVLNGASADDAAGVAQAEAAVAELVGNIDAAINALFWPADALAAINAVIAEVSGETTALKARADTLQARDVIGEEAALAAQDVAAIAV